MEFPVKIDVSDIVPPGELWIWNPPPVMIAGDPLTLEDLAREYSKYWTRITNIGGVSGN